jgi:16S rRNA (cytosine967-C5)-methyltransferase
MAGENPKSARSIAADVLNQLDPKRSYASPILNKLLPQTNEKQRATDLVFGTIRNRSAIDMVITRLADCPTERIPAELLNIIRIGAYELIYSPQTGEHAIVNEAVENTKAVAGKKQAGFVNALLRQITRHIQNRQVPLARANAKKTLPQTLSTGCEFDTYLLPDPKRLPADYFSDAFSLPKWLIEDWIVEFGAEEVRQICFASNRRPSIYIRPNTLKTTTQKLVKKFRQVDIDSETVADESMIKLKSPRAVEQLPGFAKGLFSVQNITASQAVKALKPCSGWKILDLCAAPGTKTMQLAQAADDKAKIIAADIDGERLKKVKENVSRLGLNSISIVEYENLQDAAAEIGPFDCILLDVPCSNTGVLAKRPEVRYRIRPKAIMKLTKTQSRLLETAAAMIKSKGKICYSTCSIQSSENSRLVKDFLRKNSRLKLESELLTLPSAENFDRDGGYVAILVKDKSC